MSDDKPHRFGPRLSPDRDELRSQCRLMALGLRLLPPSPGNLAADRLFGSESGTEDSGGES